MSKLMIFCVCGWLSASIATAQPPNAAKAPIEAGAPDTTSEKEVSPKSDVQSSDSIINPVPHLSSREIADVYRRDRGNANDQPGQSERLSASPDEQTKPVDVDEDAAAKGSSSDEGSTKEEAASEMTAREPLTDEELAAAIEQLGSTEFAIREQATARLRLFGKPALNALRFAMKEHADLEVRLRAKDVADGIVSGEAAGRIDQFLAGEAVPVEGWEIAREILGDNVRLRELYVDLLLRHQNVTEALSRSSKDRYEAMQAAIIQVQRGMYVERRVPTEGDVIALLLLANDHDMPLNRVDEGAILAILRYEPTAKLMKDPSTTGPFRALLGGWLLRGNSANPQDLLWHSMGWDLEESLPLAIETIKQTEDPETRSTAAQTIARFGDLSDVDSLVPLLVPLLEDARPVSEQQYVSGSLVQTQVRDAAATAIIMLHKRPLSEFGFSEDAKHPNFGFILQEIGFPTDNPKPRDVAIQKVRDEFLKAGNDGEQDAS